jgi:ribosome-binding factor A
MSQKFERRMSDLVRSHLCTLIETQLNDPRVQNVTVTDVVVTADMHYATVYFSLYADEAAQQRALKGLTSASGWLSRELGMRLRTKNTPRLIFKYDDSLERGERMQQLIDHLKDQS